MVARDSWHFLCRYASWEKQYCSWDSSGHRGLHLLASYRLWVRSHWQHYWLQINWRFHKELPLEISWHTNSYLVQVHWGLEECYSQEFILASSCRYLSVLTALQTALHVRCLSRAFRKLSRYPFCSPPFLQFLRLVFVEK